MPTLINDSNVHYVKFLRGSISAWERLLTTPERIDNDTLYFIYETANDPTEGKLYLGKKLISGAGSGGNINITDLGDIYIDGTALADKQILVFNETTEQWENTSLSTIINTAVQPMTGASAAAPGTAGLVPVPPAGAQDKFLRGDGTWTAINLPTFNTDVFTLNNNEVTLNGYNLASVGSVPIKTSNGIEWTPAPTGRLNRQITTLAKLQAQLAGTDPDPIDTDTIYMVLNGNDSTSSNRYDEYMVIGNVLELLGTFGEVNLTNYVTTTVFNTAVSNINNILQDTTDSQSGTVNLGLISRVTNIENRIGDLDALLFSDGNTTLVEEVNTINERLTWHTLQEEN